MDESHTPNLGLDDLRWLHRLARQLVRDPDDADDAVQDTVLAALTRAPRSVSAPRGWLARVLQNVVRQERRGAVRRAARERQGEVRDPTRGAAEVAEELAWHRTLVDQVNALDEPYRSTIVLRFLRGHSPRDIAREQDISVKTVHTRIERGVAHLRRALDRSHGGDRRAWLSGVAALGAPIGSGAGTGTLVIGGIVMGTMIKVTAAVLVAATCVYFVSRTPPAESPQTAAAEPAASDVKLVKPAAEDPTTQAVQRSLAAEEPLVGAPEVPGSNVLRVVLEGIPEEYAEMAGVTVTIKEEGQEGTAEVRDSWPCQGLTSEFDLDPFFAVVTERYGNLHTDKLEINVDHPAYFPETSQVPLSSGVELTTGQTVYEVRVLLVQPEFWPEFTLDVRDAHTRAHLLDIELRFTPGNVNAAWGKNGTSTLLGGGLRSPIALMGGRDPDQPEVTVAGLALSPAAGESPRLVELARRLPPEWGIGVSARAPGYAWGSTSIEVSKGARELLLVPGAELGVRLTNVQLERYASLETVPMLCVYRIREDGGNQYVRFEPLDATLMAVGLRLESLLPGGYRVAVELDGGSWTKRPVLAREELSLAAGETHELVLALLDSPEPPQRATLGGTVSFPAFGGEENVQLQLYAQAKGSPDVELSLSDMQRVGGALPTWSFRVEDLTVGKYRVQLMPFLKVLMIDLPTGGREDVELVLPELAEVQVETVDGRTGERVPLDELYYKNQEPLPGQLRNGFARADTEDPGRFRFWTAPGAVRIWPKFPSGLNYGNAWEDIELVPGLQSVRLELASDYEIRFEFREGGTVLPAGLQGLSVNRDIRAVGHEGQVTSTHIQTKTRVRVNATGVYEIHFEGVTGDRFHPLMPRRVSVRAGETAEVIVDLRRK